jgi:uncharacterized protein YneR
MKLKSALLTISLVLIASVALFFTGCGGSAEQKVKELEAGQAYKVADLFEAKDGYTVSADKDSYTFYIADKDLNYYSEEDLQQTITVTIKDKKGKTTTKDYTFTVVDTTGPEITANTPTVNLGSTLDNETVALFMDSAVPGAKPVSSAEFKSKYGGTVSMDTSAVNTSTAGTYDVEVTATDKSGNTSSKTVQVKVAESPYVGKWNATTAEMSGVSVNVSDIMKEFSITIESDGSCSVIVDADGQRDIGYGRWEARSGGGITVKDSTGSLDFDYKDGKLVIVYEGVTMYFQKV